MALLLAAGEALVQVALGEGGVDGQGVHAGLQVLGELAELGSLAAHGGDRGAQEVGDADAGDLDRVLHGEEQARAGALVDLHLQQVGTVQQHLAAGDGVFRVARDRVGERGLARAVGAHDGVGLAGLHGQVDAAQDFLVPDGDVQVMDLKGGPGLVTSDVDSFESETRTSSPSIFTRYTGTGLLAGGPVGLPERRSKHEPCSQHSRCLRRPRPR